MRSASSTRAISRSSSSRNPKRKGHSVPVRDCIPDVELLVHLSSPNIHWAIENCGQMHCEGGVRNLSISFSEFLSRCSILNRIHFVDGRVVDSVSFLCAAQSVSSFRLHLKSMKLSAFSHQLLFSLFKNFISTCRAYSRFGALAKTTIHQQLAQEQSHYADILPGLAINPLTWPIFWLCGSDQTCEGLILN